MGKSRPPRTPFLLTVFALLLAACAGVKQKATGTDAAVTGTGGSGGPGTSGSGGSRTTGSGGSSATGGSIGTDAGASDAACVPTVTTCTQPGGTYCGKIGNGCPGGSVDCGACQTGYTCTNGICIGGSSCPAIACGNYCGSIGDGCGRTLTCGSCSSSNQCNSGICASPGCVPLTCNPATGTLYCGKIGDGCGGTLDCGSCPGGMACGSGGVANLCIDPNCKPVTCTPMGGQYCGTIGDGCGGILNCGNCTNGMTCGGGGTPSVCPGSSTGGGCTGLQCQVATCTGTATTSLSGKVYDPAGKVPLYNVTVYIPNATLDAIPEGVSCDKCSAQVSGHPVAAGLTDATGAFHLTGVPSGTNIPLVMQVGKWRRQVTIPTVTSCVDNPITDVNLTRLPRTQSEGHMPKIAVTTGGSDAIECFLREIGIADSEFTTDAGKGRVNLYVGGDSAMGTTGNGQGTATFSAALGGATFPDAQTLWSNTTKLLGYDILMHSCEGGQYPNAKKPYIANIKKYADSGGRLFNSHLHFYWLRNGPTPWPTTAVYLGAQNDFPKPPLSVTATIDTTFPKGAALGQWMTNTGATTTAGSIAALRQPALRAVDHAADLAAVALHPRQHGLRRGRPVGSVSDDQHAGRGDARQSMRARRAHRHPRQERAAARRRQQRRLRSQISVPEWVQGDRPLRAGQGDGVSVLRSLGLHPARLDHAGAADRAAAGRADLAAAVDDPAAARSAAATAAAADRHRPSLML